MDKKPYKIEYHCFGDNWDEYFDTEKKARLYISERIKDGDRNLRIYTDTYDTKEDYDNGNRYEEGIYFLGDFPK